MNDRQKQISEAAIALFLTEGVGVSTASIAKAAGVSNGTLFNTFSSKQQLIDSIYIATKTEMYTALADVGDVLLSRESVHQMWRGFLDWARREPAHHRVMHLLVEAGLASDEAKAKMNQLGAPYAQRFADSLAAGTIRGPSVTYLGALVMAQLDLAITQELEGEDEALAFDILCQSLGL